jgi:hypothetical protein
MPRRRAAARIAVRSSSEIRRFTDFCLGRNSNGNGSRFSALIYFDKSSSRSFSAALSLLSAGNFLRVGFRIGANPSVGNAKRLYKCLQSAEFFCRSCHPDASAAPRKDLERLKRTDLFLSDSSSQQRCRCEVALATGTPWRACIRDPSAALRLRQDDKKGLPFPDGADFTAHRDPDESALRSGPSFAASRRATPPAKAFRASERSSRLRVPGA